MKIHSDKVDAPPMMGLSEAQTRRVMNQVPKEWLVDVSEIRISGSLVPSNSRWESSDASFNPYDQRLTIYARGQAWQKLISPILFALATHHLGFERRRGNWLSKTDAKKVSRIIMPFTESILAKGLTSTSV